MREEMVRSRVAVGESGVAETGAIIINFAVFKAVAA